MSRSRISLIWGTTLLFVAVGIGLTFLAPGAFVESEKKAGLREPLPPEAEKVQGQVPERGTERNEARVIKEKSRRDWLRAVEDLAGRARHTASQPQLSGGEELPAEGDHLLDAAGDRRLQENPEDTGREVPENLPLQNWIDGHVRSATFAVHYGDNPEPEVKLVSPSGRVIKQEHADGTNVTYHDEPTFHNKFIGITKPEPGKWQVLINGRPHLPNDTYDVSYVMDVENELELDLKLRYLSGRGVAFVVTASLADPKIPVSDVKFESYYYLMKGDDESFESHPFAFNDAGRGNDQVAGDGVFTSVGWQSAHLGQYEVVVVMTGLMEGHRFIRQAVGSIPNYYDLTSVPPLELGKTYQVITKSGALYYKMRVLRISPMGEVLVEKSGGAYAERHADCATCPYPVRDFFNFDMLLWEGVKIRLATAKP